MNLLDSFQNIEMEIPDKKIVSEEELVEVFMSLHYGGSKRILRLSAEELIKEKTDRGENSQLEMMLLGELEL